VCRGEGGGDCYRVRRECELSGESDDKDIEKPYTVRSTVRTDRLIRRRQAATNRPAAERRRDRAGLAECVKGWAAARVLSAVPACLSVCSSGERSSRSAERGSVDERARQLDGDDELPVRVRVQVHIHHARLPHPHIHRTGYSVATHLPLTAIHHWQWSAAAAVRC
jgi:hypothetical protein